jgi:hypothetical protein
LDRVLTVRFSGFEVAFSTEGAEVAENIAPAVKLSRAASAEGDELFDLARQSPRAAIIEAWLRIETRLRELTSNYVTDHRRLPVTKMIEVLAEEKILDQNTVQSVRGLMVMRNLAVHASEPELTTQKAIEFIILARAILYVLSLAKK